jgi:hypothetical protein
MIPFDRQVTIDAEYVGRRAQMNRLDREVAEQGNVTLPAGKPRHPPIEPEW